MTPGKIILHLSFIAFFILIPGLSVSFSVIQLTEEQLDEIKLFIKTRDYRGLENNYGYLLENDSDWESIVEQLKKESILPQDFKLEKKKTARKNEKEVIQAKSFIMTSTAYKMFKNAFGFGYPLLSFKHVLSSRVSGEIKGFYSSNLSLLGGRFNYDLRNGLYAGFECDYADLDTQSVKGKGILFMPFIGTEYFFSNNFSLTVDLGPTSINLQNTAETIKPAVEWIWLGSIGIWIYF